MKKVVLTESVGHTASGKKFITVTEMLAPEDAVGANIYLVEEAETSENRSRCNCIDPNPRKRAEYQAIYDRLKQRIANGED